MTRLTPRPFQPPETTPFTRPRERLASVCLFGFLCLTVVGVARADDDVAARRAGLEQQREQLQKHFQNLPLVEAKRPGDLFRLRTEGRNLVFEPLLTEGGRPKQGQFRAELEGFNSGPTSVHSANVVLPDAAGGQVEMHTFTLIHYDFSNPDAMGTLTVQYQPGYFHIERNLHQPNGFRVVRLMEQRPTPAGGAAAGWGWQGAPARQVIFTVQTNEAKAPQQFNYTAPDFRGLIRQHPKEVDAYLRPLLRELGQESVLAPDPLVAWQVFSDRYASDPDPAAAAKVKELLPALDDTDFQVRKRAQAELEALGRAGAAVLLGLDRTGLSREQLVRIKVALHPYRQLPQDEAEALRTDVGFLLDCLNCDDAEMRLAAVGRLREVTGRDVTFDVDADATTRATAVAALREALAPPAAQAGKEAELQAGPVRNEVPVPGDRK